MSDEEFWHLTAAEFMALGKRHQVRIDTDRFHAALVCMTIANFHRAPDSKVWRIDDFMPPKKVERKKLTPSEPQDPIEMRDMVRMMNKCFGGVERPPRKVG